mmetsp:Transcript_5476/g.11917  ORF Transcript_5476/g.11917 Transcript_5476/m.11917 type:complete len:205 (-) Transcript_5476:614-1228(-)
MAGDSMDRMLLTPPRRSAPPPESSPAPLLSAPASFQKLLGDPRGCRPLAPPLPPLALLWLLALSRRPKHLGVISSGLPLVAVLHDSWGVMLSPPADLPPRSLPRSHPAFSLIIMGRGVKDCPRRWPLRLRMSSVISFSMMLFMNMPVVGVSAPPMRSNMVGEPSLPPPLSMPPALPPAFPGLPSSPSSRRAGSSSRNTSGNMAA